jgi:hypothetical protein
MREAPGPNVEKSEEDHGMEREEERERPTTTPPDHTSEATTPPGSGERDEEAIEKGEEKLDQAGGGH